MELQLTECMVIMSKSTNTPKVIFINIYLVINLIKIINKQVFCEEWINKLGGDNMYLL
jgi:hypothetical protein